MTSRVFRAVHDSDAMRLYSAGDRYIAMVERLRWGVAEVAAFVIGDLDRDTAISLDLPRTVSGGVRASRCVEIRL
jgi:hypothetical protein